VIMTALSTKARAERFPPAGSTKIHADTGERRMEICEAVIDLAAALFDIDGRELRRPGRSPLAVARVRQIAMYVAHVALGLPMGEIGRGFGRDRTTVVHACHLIEDMRDDAEFERIVATCERVVRAAFDIRDAG
jgi:chromosomal replication initiation ATPase DnaA